MKCSVPAGAAPVAQDRVADLEACAEETSNTLRTVQAFTHEPVDRAPFSAAVQRSVAAALRRARTRVTQILIVIQLGFGAIVFSLWVGGRDVPDARMSGGDLSAFVFNAVLLATSGAQMNGLFGEVQPASVAADRPRLIRSTSNVCRTARNTYHGEKGVRLSGGPRQRIAIARAILRDPAVLPLEQVTRRWMPHRAGGATSPCHLIP